MNSTPVHSTDEFESLTLDIIGPPFRVRVPASEAPDLKRAAELLRDRIERSRDDREPTERAIIRAALEIVFEAYVSQRNAVQTLQRLLRMLDSLPM
jgi:hypothetical protein